MVDKLDCNRGRGWLEGGGSKTQSHNYLIENKYILLVSEPGEYSKHLVGATQDGVFLKGPQPGLLGASMEVL